MKRVYYLVENKGECSFGDRDFDTLREAKEYVDKLRSGYDNPMSSERGKFWRKVGKQMRIIKIQESSTYIKY